MNTVTIEQIAPEHHGDWHDKPLRYAVYGLDAYPNKFSTKKEALRYASLRRRFPREIADRKFVCG